MTTCRLCGGTRKIHMNLAPELPPVSMRPEPEDASTPVPSVSYERREYVCPECSPVVRESDLSVLETDAHVSLDTLQRAINVEDVKMHVRVSMARAIADKLVRSECFKFTEGRINDFERTQSFKGQVLVGKIGSLDNIIEQTKQARQHAITDVLSIIDNEAARIWKKAESPGIAFKWLQQEISNVLDNVRHGRYDA